MRDHIADTRVCSPKPVISTWTKVFVYFANRSRWVCNPPANASGCKPDTSDAGKLLSKYLGRN